MCSSKNKLYKGVGWNSLAVWVKVIIVRIPNNYPSFDAHLVLAPIIWGSRNVLIAVFLICLEGPVELQGNPQVPAFLTILRSNACDADLKIVMASS